MLLLTRLSPTASYASNVLPSLLIVGVGMGCIFAPAFSTATLGVDGSEAGVASAMVNTSQQVGGSVGTALLSTLFASSAAAYATSHVGTPGLANAAAIHGYTTAFDWAAGIFALGLLLALVILPSKAHSRTSTTEIAIDGRTPVVAQSDAHPDAPVVAPSHAPVVAVLVTGPCCHFGVATHVEHAGVGDGAS
jgi:hypothetical protein